MLLTIFWSLMYVELKRIAMGRMVSELMRNFWDQWEVRVLLLFSMSLQLLLGRYGDRLKYNGPYITIFVWIIYLLANWAATVVLTTLLRGPVSVDNSLVIFWTPFLLWHLGSPFNIAAYSLEDNEIWHRHFLGMLVQFVSALYVLFSFWTGSELAYMAVPLLVAGVFKYGERIWALRSASEKEVTTSLYSTEKTEVIEPKIIRTGWMVSRQKFHETIVDGARNSQMDNLSRCYISYNIFKPLFCGVPFEVAEEAFDAINLSSKSPDEAFELVEIELRFLYEQLYTKVPLQQSGLFIAFHCFCFFSTVSALIALSVFVGKLQYQIVDVVVTYLLLVSAIALDLYSAVLLSVSNWTLVRWNKPRNWVQKLYRRFVAPKFSKKIRSGRAGGGLKRMGQHDFINYLVEKKKENWFTRALRELHYKDLENVTPELKRFIFFNLREKHKKPSHRASSSWDKGIQEFLSEPIRSFLERKSFIQIVVIWHIATNLLYDSDHHKYPSDMLGQHCEISKWLSNYMMYLVMVRPTLLPPVGGALCFKEVIIRETRKEAARFFRRPKNISLKRMRKVFIASLLSLVRVSNAPAFYSGIEMSALLDGSWVANQLSGMVTGRTYDQEEKWEKLSNLWMEMMCYAASHCSWREHAKELIHGGELLSYVSLLMAHLGLSEEIAVVNSDLPAVNRSRFQSG